MLSTEKSDHCCTLSKFLTHRISEHNKWFLFYAPRYGVSCYIAFDNWNIHIQNIQIIQKLLGKSPEN